MNKMGKNAASRSLRSGKKDDRLETWVIMPGNGTRREMHTKPAQVAHGPQEAVVAQVRWFGEASLCR